MQARLGASRAHGRPHLTPPPARARPPIAERHEPVAAKVRIVQPLTRRADGDVMGHAGDGTADSAHTRQAGVRPDPPANSAGLYLLHLDPRYKHAQHYLGYADDIAARVHQHAAGGSKASPLIRAASAAGCRITLTRVWLGDGRTRERQLKRQGGLGRHCPVCRRRGYRRGRAQHPSA